MPRFDHNSDGLVEYTDEQNAIRDADEKAWNDDSANRKLKQIREIRNEKLAETDWLVVSEKITDEQKTWRENLRKIPQDFTSESDYDTLLERNDDNTLKHSVWSKP